MRHKMPSTEVAELYENHQSLQVQLSQHPNPQHTQQQHASTTRNSTVADTSHGAYARVLWILYDNTAPGCYLLVSTCSSL